MVKYFEVRVKGVAPLLMNRFAIEEFGVGVSKRKKNYIQSEEAEKSCYKNSKGRLYLPGEWFYSALVKAATKQKYEGKKTYKDIFKSGCVIEEEEITNFSPQKYDIDSRAVVVNRARIVKSRPRFNDWEATFNIQIIHDDLINEQILKEALDDAGINGVGDYRPRFGRFIVTSFKEIGKKGMKK